MASLSAASLPRPDPKRAKDGEADGILAPPRLPPAAAQRSGVGSGSGSGRVSPVFALTLLSAADGSLLLLAAAGRLSTLGGALAVGLLVVAGAGSWLAARQAFGRRPGARGWRILGLLGVLTLASTVAAAWLGATLGQAVTLHVLPKAAGVVLLLLSAEMAGVRVPAVRLPGARGARVPLPFAALATGAALEAALWTA